MPAINNIYRVAPNPRYLSTGSTMLNLALSDLAWGGFIAGKYYFLVGDSRSGKTFISMTCLAEAGKHPVFSKYRFIYDNIEDGMLMDVEKFFGPVVKQKLESPAKDEDGEDKFSLTIQDFYYNLDDAITDGRPFIYILDSMDSLTSNEEGKKFDQQKDARRKNKETAGSYGDGKAKVNSAGIRRAMAGVRNTGSILIVISQTRDNPAAGMFQSSKTRSGGHALRFYATCEIWSALVGQIKKSVKSKQRAIGNKVGLRLHKNRITGKLHKVETAIYPSFGIDDVGSVYDFLVEEKWWPKKNAKERQAIIIEHSRGEGLIQLLAAAQECWSVIQEASRITRHPRYGQEEEE